MGIGYIPLIKSEVTDYGRGTLKSGVLKGGVFFMQIERWYLKKSIEEM